MKIYKLECNNAIIFRLHFKRFKKPVLQITFVKDMFPVRIHLCWLDVSWDVPEYLFNGGDYEKNNPVS